MEISEKIKKVYREKYRKYGDSPKSLFWISKGAAHQRFRQFWAEIDFNQKSVLDIGCGFGEFGNFLSKRYKGVKYLGIDIVPEFIDEGRRKYPYLKLEVADYLERPDLGKFDIVIASGVLNSNVENNLGYRKRAISAMFAYTTDIFAFNMLGSYPQPENDPKSNVWYADSLEILEYCMSLTRRVIFRANYHPKDFTVIMYRAKRHLSGDLG
jgi:SAM-dependent methyltransferase